MPIASINGAHVHYKVEGRGPVLVLLHGIGSGSASFERQLSGLAADFKVIAWDAPGYGKSSDPPAVTPSVRVYSDSLRDLLRVLNLEHVFLLGHSMGGVIAQDFYRSYPNCVDALVLADTTEGGSAPEKLEERLQMIREMTPAQLAEERAPKLLSSHAPEKAVRFAVHIMSEVRSAGYEFAARALANSDTSGVVAGAKVPVLLIWGERDQITPLWTNAPGHVRCEIILGAGHLCYLEQPEQFNDLVRSFLLSRHD